MFPSSAGKLLSLLMTDPGKPDYEAWQYQVECLIKVIVI